MKTDKTIRKKYDASKENEYYQIITLYGWQVEPFAGGGPTVYECGGLHLIIH